MTIECEGTSQLTKAPGATFPLVPIQWLHSCEYDSFLRQHAVYCDNVRMPKIQSFSNMCASRDINAMSARVKPKHRFEDCSCNWIVASMSFAVIQCQIFK